MAHWGLGEWLTFDYINLFRTTETNKCLWNENKKIIENLWTLSLSHNIKNTFQNYTSLLEVLAGHWMEAVKVNFCVCRLQQTWDFCQFIKVNHHIIWTRLHTTANLTPFNCRLIADWLSFISILTPSWRIRNEFEDGNCEWQFIANRIIFFITTIFLSVTLS